MKLTPYQIYRLQINLRRLFLLTVIIAVGYLVRLRGCQAKKESNLLRADNVMQGTGQTLMGATMSAYDDTIKIWELTTDKLIQDAEAAKIHVSPVRLKMFHKRGTVAVTVLADSGNTTNQMEQFYIWGHVRITSFEGNKLRSKSLSWDKPSRRLHSVDYVEISTASGEVLRGKGFDAAEDLTWWEFHQDVSGRLNNFESEIGFDKGSQ